MMTHAYSESYLEDVMNNFGYMFDFAVNHCHIVLADFYKMFMDSDLPMQIEKANPKFLAGLSGPELAFYVCSAAPDLNLDASDYVVFERTPEFWIGWILAYYQWYSGHSFLYLQQKGLDVQTISCLYPTLHEADVSKFVSVAEGIIQLND